MIRPEDIASRHPGHDLLVRSYRNTYAMLAGQQDELDRLEKFLGDTPATSGSTVVGQKPTTPGGNSSIPASGPGSVVTSNVPAIRQARYEAELCRGRIAALKATCQSILDELNSYSPARVLR